MYAQVINDEKGHTIFSLNTEGKTTELASKSGKTISELLLKNKISECTFDRSGYAYHGRVKAFAEALREGGIKV